MKWEFPATPWSVIHAAALNGDANAREALNALCGAYWYPLYGYARRNGRSHDDASDLVQGFFARFVSKNYLENLDSSAGKFRSYLLKSLTHYSENVRKQQSTQSRGGGISPESLDDLKERYASEPVTDETPEVFYERRWAVELLRAASVRLEERYRTRGALHKFSVLSKLAHGPAPDLAYAQAAEQLGISEGNLRVTINRFKGTYGRMIKEEAARTVADPEQIDEEVSYLIRVLGTGNKAGP